MQDYAPVALDSSMSKVVCAPAPVAQLLGMKEHGVGALNPILGRLDPMGNAVNPATIGNLSDMDTKDIMGSKKRPLDVAKFHFNIKD